MIRQLVLSASPSCGTCPARHLCDEGTTAGGCSPFFSPTAGLAAPVLHSASPEFAVRWTECNGLDLNIDAKKQTLPPLPPYFPQVRPWKRVSDLSDITAVALPLAHVAALASNVQKTSRTAKQILGLSPDQLLVVTGFANDRFLESSWPRRNRSALLRAIAEVAPDAAIAWGFSVYQFTASGNPYLRLHQLYNIKRSLVVYAELQDLGIPAIPHTYWGSQSDLRRWSAWLESNTLVDTIAIDLQTADADRAWIEIMRDLGYFRTILSRDIRCLFNGVCRAERVKQLSELWPNSSLCNMGPYFAVVFPRKTLFGLAPGRIDGADIDPFHRTISQFTQLVMGESPEAGKLSSSPVPREAPWDGGHRTRSPVALSGPIQPRLFPEDDGRTNLAGIGEAA